MPLRRVLLRMMLWSLALAAATGVLAVLFRGGDLVWRIIGTGFTMSVACGLMLPVASLIDREKTRSAGLLGMAAVIGEFLMALMAIWQAPRHLFGARVEEELVVTMLLFGLAAVAIMCLLKLRHESHGVIAGQVGLAVGVAAFVAFMIATWTRRGVSQDEDWWETGGAIALLGGLSVLSLVGLGTGDRRHWRWAGILAGIVACTMWLSEIWIGVGSDLGFVVFCVLLSVAAVTAHANLSLICTLTPEQRWVRWGTIAAAILTAYLIDQMIADDRLFGVDTDYSLLGRFAAAGGIVTGCGTMALLVLTRLNRRVDFEPASPELTEMTVVCPRCRKKQAVPIGNSACEACGLRISIRIEDPRCPQCEYLLYGLTSDRCPECGTLISAQASAGPT